MIINLKIQLYAWKNSKPTLYQIKCNYYLK